MRTRKQEIGTRNLIGKNVAALRTSKKMSQKELMAQLQLQGIEINASGLSKLEGQIRSVTDKELVALAHIFQVSVEDLLR